MNYKNVMIVQRIPPATGDNGSYNTGAVDIRFFGRMLEKTEKQGWIFASDGNAFVGVKFLDDQYIWNKAKDVALPKNHHEDSKDRYLIHAADIQSHESLEHFISQVLENELRVEDDRLRYISADEGIDITMFTYYPDKHEQFKLPRNQWQCAEPFSRMDL